MKKRIATLFLAVVMTASLLIVPAEAASAEFYDVADNHMATAIETLRLMGVLDGYADGSFRPGNNLTRAQFSKMAVFAMDGSKELGQYATTTIFPDVKPSHWASNYVNMAARKGMIAGFTNGTFGPERTVTAAQAVAILLRMLGYKDADLGGVWPTSYMLKANEIGLIDRAGIVSPNAPLTRGQAAIVFMNLLKAKTADGGTLYEMSELVRLTAVDGGRGTMTVKGLEKPVPMMKPAVSTTLVGLTGRVVMHNGKALTFLPEVDGSNGVTNAAVIVYSDGDDTGLAVLAGNSNYKIFKNGLPADVSDLRKNDVAIYSAATNSILVCDTRVKVYYEDCSPSASAPGMIVALGHEFPVVPTGIDSLAKFKPGKVMTLLLTADGQVAGAVELGGKENKGNAIGILDESGNLKMICGDTLIDLGNPEFELDDEYGEYKNQAVTIASSSRDVIDISILAGGAAGKLDAAQGMLGKKNLAENVKVYDGGELVTQGVQNIGNIKEGRISYAHSNWRDEVDLIVLNGGKTTQNAFYGVANVTKEEMLDENGDVIVNEDGTVQTRYLVTISNGESAIGPFAINSSVKDGAFVAAFVSDSGLDAIRPLTRLAAVSNHSWIGTSAVIYNGRTYAVAPQVYCYNSNRGLWMTLEEAMAYANTLNLYVTDQMVRMVEIKQ